MLGMEKGWRGYVASRPIGGHHVPQRVQNLVLRDYARRNQIQFHLSATEYGMQDCYMMLYSELDQLDQIDGLLFYSIHQLPDDPMKRSEVLLRVLSQGKGIRFATEDLCLRAWEDVEILDDLFMVAALACKCNEELPFSRYTWNHEAWQV